MNLAGGWDNVVANVPAETFDMFKGYNVMDVISLTIMYVATFTVGQEAVSRYYAARDGKAARQGSVLAAIVNFIYAFVPTLMGIIVLALITMGKFGLPGCWCPLCTSGSCYGSNAGNYLRIVICRYRICHNVKC